MSEQIGVISIPADEDGFVLMQCPLCGEFFKVRAEDLNAEDVIEIWCPCCGLKSDTYFTKDVIELALKKAENYTILLLQLKKGVTHTHPIPIPLFQVLAVPKRAPASDMYPVSWTH